VAIELLSASRCAFHNHMHLDRTNNISKMIVKMLTHSHMTRSLGGVSTFTHSGVFEKLKRLFSTTPEVEKETEANGGHRGDRTVNRTRSLVDRTRPVSFQRLRVF
jgi:hypothetical protein